MAQEGACRLIDNYLPADYMDVVAKEIATTRAITPEELHKMLFSQIPGWINRLLELRNTLVKPLGLQTEGRFTDMICDKCSDEVIFGMPDRHLTFHVSIWCGALRDNRQMLRLTTVVKYNNMLGRIYFLIIRPFHHIITRSMFFNIDSRLS